MSKESLQYSVVYRETDPETGKQTVDTWTGTVTRLESCKNCYTGRIESRSGITFAVGRYGPGWFVALPDFGVAAALSFDLADTFFNREALVRAGLNPVDAATVANALKVLVQSGKIKKEVFE